MGASKLIEYKAIMQYQACMTLEQDRFKRSIGAKT